MPIYTSIKQPALLTAMQVVLLRKRRPLKSLAPCSSTPTGVGCMSLRGRQPASVPPFWTSSIKLPAAINTALLPGSTSMIRTAALSSQIYSRAFTTIIHKYSIILLIFQQIPPTENRTRQIHRASGVDRRIGLPCTVQSEA